MERLGLLVGAATFGTFVHWRHGPGRRLRAYLKR